MLGVVLGVLDVTYLCWIQAASMMAPEGIIYFPEQSSSVISVSTVTGLLKLLSPLKVNLDNAPLALLAYDVQDFQMSKLKFYIKLGRISIFTFN